LIFLSATIFILQFFLFGDIRDTFFYLFEDLAFLPIQILIVTFVIERIIDQRDKKEKLSKIHVLINVFYSEVGRDCITIMTKFIGNFSELQDCVTITDEWDNPQFVKAIKTLTKFDFVDAHEPYDFQKLNSFLSDKKQFMLSLLENQSLIEHDEFTNMLWALFHVQDELQFRANNFDIMPEEDIKHILLDIRRAYPLLLIEWMYYMQNLKEHYPYLYRFSLKNHPFIKEQRAQLHIFDK
jgi:hypothetical protein